MRYRMLVTHEVNALFLHTSHWCVFTLCILIAFSASKLTTPATSGIGKSVISCSCIKNSVVGRC